MIYPKTILCISLLLTCSCALQPSKPITDASSKPNENRLKVTPVQQVSTLELLNYFDLYSNRDADAQKAMLNELNQGLARDPNNLLLRMRLTGALTLPTSHYRDTAKAELQLQSIIQNYSLSRSELALMGLLYEFTEDSNKQQQKLRDEMKKSEALEKKLNDLKNIEKTMIQRSSKLESQ